MKGKHISKKTQKKLSQSTRDYDRASIAKLMKWTKEGDGCARQQLLFLKYLA